MMKKLLMGILMTMAATTLHANTPSPEYIYKISTRSDWMANKSSYTGNDWDQKDGFIHMSTAAQVERIARKYYADEEDLVLLKIWYKDIQDKVKWEPNSQGNLYPHIYGMLNETHVVEIIKFNPDTFEYGDLG